MTRKLGSFALIAALAAALLVATVAAARNASAPLPSGEGGEARIITYQGRLANAAGQPLTGAVTLTIRLYSQALSGTLAWSETHTDVQLLDGVFTVALGSSTPLQPEHVAGPSWIEISVDDGDPLAPRQPLGAAPYALLAGQAVSATWSSTATYAAASAWGGLAGVPADLADGDQVGAPVSHTHPYAAEVHDHDARYYTQTLVDALLATKSDVGHTHTWTVTEVMSATWSTTSTWATGAPWSGLSDVPPDLLDGDDVGALITHTHVITGFAPLTHTHPYAAETHDHDGRYYTQAQADALLATKVDASQVYTRTEVEAALATKSDADHDHAGAYALASHLHAGTDITTPVSQAVSATWSTTSTWAASSSWGGLSDVPAGLADGIDDTDDNVSWAEISAIVGSGLNQVAAGNHTHDGRYYTESEIDTALAAKIDASQVYTRTQVDAALAGKAAATHTHAGGDITTPVAEAITSTWSTTSTFASFALSSPWSGLAGVPADLLDGDDDTIYSPGFGLALAGTQFAVTTTTVQRRVSGACAVGSTIQAIAADGSVDCQPDAPGRRALAPAATVSTTLDASGDAGWYGSVTVGVDGLPIISYEDKDTLALRVAHCQDVACMAATVITVDLACNGALWTSIAIGADGKPIISYYADNFGSLRVAHCDDLACATATITDVDGVPVTGDAAGYYGSIAIGADGLPVISHYDSTNTALRLSHCNDLACTSATNTTVDNSGGGGGDTGWWTSIAVGADGLPIISYYDNTTANKNLKVAHCNDLACTSAISTTLDAAGDVGWYTSLVIGADGLPIIGYMDFSNRDLKVAHCTNLACTSAVTTTLATAGDVGRYSSITVGADGLPIIAYYDYTAKALKLARCVSFACTAATVITLDASSSDVGYYPAITIGADSLPLVAYYDVANTRFKALHCSNALCAPYFRRR